MKPVEPIENDRWIELSDSAWHLICERGQFAELEPHQEWESTGSNSSRLIIVLSGSILQCDVADGRLVSTGWSKSRGETFGHANLHLGLPKFRIGRAEAKGARILLLDQATIFELIASEELFARYLFRDLSLQVIRARKLLSEQQQYPLVVRMARQINDIVALGGEMDMTQDELAKMLGVTRISVGKALSSLEERGLIQRRYGRIEVTNSKSLSAWVTKKTALPVA